MQRKKPLKFLHVKKSTGQSTSRRHIDHSQDPGAGAGTTEVQLWTLGASEINTIVYRGAGPPALLLAFALLIH